MGDSVVDPPPEPRRPFVGKVAGIWLAIVTPAFVLLETVRTASSHDQLEAAIVVVCYLLGVGLAASIACLYQWFHGAGAAVFSFLFGAMVAATAGFALSALILLTPLEFIVRGDGVFGGFMILLMPIIGVFFGGAGGIAAAIAPDSRQGRLKALAVGAALPIGLVGIPMCLDGGLNDFVWSVVATVVGILGTSAGLWLTSSRNTNSTAAVASQR